MAGQTSYSVNHDELLEGMLSDTRDRVVESHPAFEAIPFGRGVVHADADAEAVRAPRRNTATIVFSGDLVTSNTINGKVNGTAISQVTFSSNHATTMGLIKTQIEAVLTTLEIEGTVTVGGANDRTITVVAEDANILFADWVVAAGAGQATVTHVYSSTTPFLGVAMHQHQEANAAKSYTAGQSVGVVRRGKIRVKVKDAVAKGEAAYLNVATANEEGMFTNVSTGNLATGGTFRTAAADNGIAELEINLP